HRPRLPRALEYITRGIRRLCTRDYRWVASRPMRRTWGKLGGQLGLFCVGLGLLLIGLAWNGAAGLDFVSGQIPYLLSGGALGLALVAIGVGFVVVQNSRRDRALLEAQVKELDTAVTRLANAVAGGAGAVHGQDVRGRDA